MPWTLSTWTVSSTGRGSRLGAKFLGIPSLRIHSFFYFKAVKLNRICSKYRYVRSTNLKAVGRPSPSEAIHKQLRRIAEFLGEDVNELVTQYDDVLHRAKHMIANSSSTPTIDAWCAAIFHGDMRWKNLRRSAPIKDTEVLVRCLTRAAAFSASSSGCEHTFSVTQWMHEGRRGFTTGELEEDELKCPAVRISSVQN